MTFYERLLELCSEHNTSPSAVAKKVGLSNAAATYWRRGAVPKLETLVKIGGVFGVDWLDLVPQEEQGPLIRQRIKEKLVDSPQVAPVSPALDATTQELVDLAHTLDASDRALLVEMARSIQRSRDKHPTED